MLQNQPTAKPPKELGRHSFVTGLGHPDQLMLLGQDAGCSLEAWEGLGDLPEVTAIAQASYKGNKLEKKGQNELDVGKRDGGLGWLLGSGEGDGAPREAGNTWIHPRAGVMLPGAWATGRQSLQRAEGSLHGTPP